MVWLGLSSPQVDHACGATIAVWGFIVRRGAVGMPLHYVSHATHMPEGILNFRIREWEVSAKGFEKMDQLVEKQMAGPQ